MGQVYNYLAIVRVTMQAYYSQTGVFDILIIIMRTIMGQVVCATEAAHMSLMYVCMHNTAKCHIITVATL